ncbi:DUF1372 family protein [Streptococcus suis]|uniref:DUF1372 family protein n=1 Tax=Streptococcus suis TaxID=1307 RepID=UPI002AAA6A4B|nr:DUF1372 family protein [Streptococcus suis]
MKETVKFTVSLNLVLLAVMTILYMVYQIGYKIAKHEQQPVIIYQVDNAGIEMFGKVTAKDVLDGHYYVEVKPYGRFLATREQYDSINIGDEMPDWLKGRKK